MLFLILGVISSLIGNILKYLTNYLKGYFEISIFIYIPIIAAFILGFINKYYLKKDSGFHKIELNSYFDFNKELIIILSGLLSIWSGFSVGMVGIIIYISKFSSKYIYKKIKSTDVNLTNASLTSGIMASYFGFPLFAIFFVIEIFIKKIDFKNIFYIIIVTFSSYIFSKSFFELKPFISYSMDLNLSFNNLFKMIIIGITLGFFSALYVKSLFFSKNELILKRPFLVTILVGVFLSIISYNFYELFSIHFDTFKILKLKKYSFGFIFVLILIKILITNLSLNFGGYGGAFLPGIVIGAMSGLLFLDLFQLPFYFLIGIGIIGFYSGFSDAPISASFLGIGIFNYNFKIAIYVIIVSFISNYIREKIIAKDLY